MTTQQHHRPAPASRRVFCNRTLNLRSIEAVGFDMDYTLIHYHAEAWEQRAYESARQRLKERGLPVDDLRFDPDLVRLGLILDLERGNVVKANRFGYVKQAGHGTRMLDLKAQREAYSRVVVDLSEPRWVFMNTLFALSEACLYLQLVDRLDADAIEGVIGYPGLYDMVRSSLDETHMEGRLKAEIAENPDEFVQLDEELPLAMLDLKHAGKKLLLITNSEWAYTRAMMHYAFDRFLPGSMTWRELFEIVVVSARKPHFFTSPHPVFEVVDESGLLRPFLGLPEPGCVYLGGNAGLIERALKLDGEQILYVGDHIFADVQISKNLLRWRTALVARELEVEIEALESFKAQQAELTRLMERKEQLEQDYAQLKLALQRRELGYGPQPPEPTEALRRDMQRIRTELPSLDERIAPLARAAGELSHARWGLLLRTGNDKSHLARQIERYADVYTSRVSNLLALTPFAYLRSPRGSLPHDSGPGGGVG